MCKIYPAHSYAIRISELIRNSCGDECDLCPTSDFIEHYPIHAVMYCLIYHYGKGQISCDAVFKLQEKNYHLLDKSIDKILIEDGSSCEIERVIQELGELVKQMEVVG